MREGWRSGGQADRRTGGRSATRRRLSVVTFVLMTGRPQPAPAALAALAALACLASCQNRTEAPTLDLPPTSDTLTLASGAVTEGAWMHGETWAVLGPDDGTVWLVDFAEGSTVVVGSPGENYRNPYGIFSYRDTLFVNDWGLGRTTMWSKDGTLLDTVPATNTTRGALPRARDSAGRFYVAVRPHPGPDGQGNQDSAVVLRASHYLDRVDTVAMLSPLDIEEVFGDAGRRFERKVFSGEDAWGVYADGTLWVARINHNRVSLFSAGADERRGRMLPDPVFPVTRADREVFLREFPEGLRKAAQQLPFAEIKPPFLAGLTGSDGNVWLQKSRELSDTVQMYHQVGRDGELLALIRVPLAARILAISPDRILVAQGIENGIRLWQFLHAPVPSDQDSPEISMTTLPK